MKKFTFILMIFVSSMSMAQKAPVDFESGGNGAAWTWTVFENATNPALEKVANPFSTGINTSATVAKFTALKAGQPWAGCETAHGAGIGQFTLDSSNCIIKIMVYKTVISDVGIKLATNTGWSKGEIKVANTKINEWETLTFDFSSHMNPGEGIYDQFIVFPDFVARTSDNVIYFDNITFNRKGAVPVFPVAAAPTPTRNAADVISLFSNAYTNVQVDTWRTDWSVATLKDTTVSGNAVKRYTQLDYAGIETVTKQLDVSTMTHFHIDVWSADFTSFSVKLVDFGADGAYGGGNDVEHQVNFTTPKKAEWVSLDIPLSDFTGLTTKGHLAQYILVAQPSGSNTIYVDNVYFFKGGISVATGPATPAPTPTRNAADVISLFSNAYTNVQVDTWRTDWSSATLKDTTVSGNAVKKYAQLDFVGIETVAKQLNISTMTHFHIDVWSADFTFFGIKLVDFGADGAYGGGNDVEHQVNFTTPKKSEWVSLNIPLSDFTGLTTKGHLAQYILVGQPTGSNSVYVDNVYFYKDNPVNIKESAFIQNRIQVYPNPVRSGERVRLSSDVKVVDVFESGGKIVKSLNTSVIETDGLKQGIYILRIHTLEGEIQTDRLIVK